MSRYGADAERTARRVRATYVATAHFEVGLVMIASPNVKGQKLNHPPLHEKRFESNELGSTLGTVTMIRSAAPSGEAAHEVFLVDLRSWMARVIASRVREYDLQRARTCPMRWNQP